MSVLAVLCFSARMLARVQIGQAPQQQWKHWLLFLSEPAQFIDDGIHVHAQHMTLQQLAQSAQSAQSAQQPQSLS
jgi:hypothetical protein